MQTYKYIIAVLLLGSLLPACKKDNFLNRLPQDALTEETFFKNENDLKLFCNQFYSSLPVQSPLNDNNSDNLVPRNADVFLSGQYTIPTSGGGWSASDWSGIRNCNYFLDHYQKADAEDSVKDKYAGEARFFRAYYYWSKVKQFGDVPWIATDLTDSSAALYAPRDPHKMVMDSVLTDLDFAVDHLPAAAEAGRLNKYIALALKGRICLWEGTFRKYHNLGDDKPFLQAAADASLQIISSGLYDIYTTGHPDQDYYNLFVQTDLSSIKETIMSATYIKDVLTHNLTRQINEAGTGWSKDFINSFLCTDGLPISFSHLYKGDDSLDEEVINRDPRLKQMVATRGSVVLSIGGSPDTLALPRIGTNITTTGYEIIKNKSSDPEQWNANQSTLGLFIFRYAETLLIYAEAKAELGECDQQVLDMTINKLRDRVGMPHMIIANLVKDPDSDFPDLPVLIDEIRRERRIELAGEGSRFDDILRWAAGKVIENPMTILGMKLVPAVKAQYPADQVRDIPLDANGYIRVYPSVSARKWDDKMYLYPIPIQEMTLNPSIKQNPGWD